MRTIKNEATRIEEPINQSELKLKEKEKAPKP